MTDIDWQQASELGSGGRRAGEIATVHREALELLNTVDARQLWLLIASHRNGYPSGGYDAVGGSSEDTSTERAALAPDSAAAALRDLDRTMGALRRAVDDLGHLHAMWTAAPKKAACDHCGDFTGERYRTHCRWCVSWLNDTGQLPSQKDIVAKQMGGRPGGRNRKDRVA